MTKPVITTRAGKGSALTWTEGDTNLTNLRDATITVSDGTTSTAIDLNGTITFTAGTGISVDESSGTITIANTQSAGASTLDDLTDVSTSGAMNGHVLTYNSTGGNWVSQLPNSGATTLDGLDDVNTAGVSDQQVLSYNNSLMRWEPRTISSGGISNVVEDTTPQLGGDLDGQGQIVSFIELKKYKETVYNIGSTDSPTLDYANGNVQKVTITSGLSLPTFSSASSGQSITLLVTGSGTATGASGYKFAGGATTLTSYSVISIFYDGTTYWASIATDFQ